MATRRKNTSAEKSSTASKGTRARSRTQARRKKSARRTKKATSRSTRSRRAGARKYGEKATESVENAMHEMKRGTLRSGRTGKKVRSRKQAVAIGLSEARKKGAKVPSRRKKSA